MKATITVGTCLYYTGTWLTHVEMHEDAKRLSERYPQDNVVVKVENDKGLALSRLYREGVCFAHTYTRSVGGIFFTQYDSLTILVNEELKEEILELVKFFN